jgi:hypothetical protein
VEAKEPLHKKAQSFIADMFDGGEAPDGTFPELDPRRATATTDDKGEAQFRLSVPCGHTGKYSIVMTVGDAKSKPSAPFTLEPRVASVFATVDGGSAPTVEVNFKELKDAEGKGVKITTLDLPDINVKPVDIRGQPVGVARGEY